MEFMNNGVHKSLDGVGPGQGNGLGDGDAWRAVLATLPMGPRFLARMLSPFRQRLFSDELRLFVRLMADSSPQSVRWARDYLSHPRYRRGSISRRLGLRCRVSLLEEWSVVRPDPGESREVGAGNQWRD